MAWIPISPPVSPISNVEDISPPQSPIALDMKTIELTPEWFDESSNEWRQNKTFSKKTKLFYYKTNTDSPLASIDFTPLDIFPNAGKWSECGYISSNGEKCQKKGIFNRDEIKMNREYDYEKYTDVHFCMEHKQFERKEQRKRILHLECIILEKQLKK